MTLEEFLDCLDRRGPHLASWPLADRAAADGLLARDIAARRQHEAALRLDDALVASRFTAPDEALRLRIAAIAQTVAQDGPVPAASTVVPLPARRRPSAWALATATSLAASILLGFIVGVSDGAADVALQEDPAFDALMLGPDDSDEALPWL